MYRKIAVAALLLSVGSAAHAAGVLPDKLKAGLKNTVPALSAKLPALSGGLKSPKLAALSGGSTAAALPELPGLGDTYWLNYNLTVYPSQLISWVQVRPTYVSYGVNGLLGRVVAGPNNTCSDESCAPGADPRVRGIANYAADILDIGNGAAGLIIKGPPPKPLMPGELYWLDYNVHEWSSQVVDYAYDEFVGRTLTDTSTLLREVGNISLSDAQYSFGNVLAAAGNAAAGLIIKGPPPKPLLPGEALP